MPPIRIEKLLGEDPLSLAFGADRAAELAKKMTAATWTLAPEPVRGAKDVQVLDRTVAVTGDLTASATFHKSGEAIEPLGDGARVAPPRDRGFAVLHLDGNAGVATSGSVPVGAASLSFNGSLRAGLAYDHWVTAPKSRVRRKVLEDLVKGARLPSTVGLDAIDAGTLHRLRASMHLDLGLSAEIGFARELGGTLFPGVDWPIRFAFEGSLKAAVGLAIQDDLDFAVGRIGVDSGARHVRVRVSRARERRFTAGALFQLQCDYDLGSGAGAIVERLLGKTPFERVQSAARELADAADAVSSGDWDALKERLTDEAQESLGKLLDVDRLLTSAAGRRALDRFVDVARELVDAYDGLSEELRSLWDRVLGSTGLEPGSKLRRHLADVLALEDAGKEELLERLLGDEAGRVLDLFGLLSDLGLDELVTSADARIEAARDRAVDLARQALTFLDRVDRLDDDALAKIYAFAERHGIASKVAWLRDHATSVADLRRKLDDVAQTSIRTLVERLLDKAWDAIDADDVAKLRSWARKAAPVLRDVQNLDATLKRKLEELRGTFEVKVGFEIDRLARTTALVDVELDPRNRACRDAFDLLRRGDAKGFLAALPEPDDDDPPYRIREAVFTSKRVRGTIGTMFLSWLGLATTSRKRVEESIVRVERDGASRTGTHSAGVIVQVEKDKALWWSDVRLVVTGTASGANARDVRASYGAVDVGFTVNFHRDDRSTTARELDGVRRLLDRLAFVGPDLRSTGFEVDRPSRLSLSLTFPPAAVPAFLDRLDERNKTNRQRLDADFLAAAVPWFDDDLVGEKLGGTFDGPYLAAVARGDAYADRFGNPQEIGNTTFEVTIDGRTERVSPALPRWNSLVVLSLVRGKSPRRLRDAASKLNVGNPSRSPRTIDDALRRFARGLKVATPNPSSWPTPTFPVWLLLERIASAGGSAPRGAIGVATFRWKRGEEWVRPLLYRAGTGRPAPG